MEPTLEIKPMLNTRSVRFGGSGDRGWGSEKIARLEASREANEIMKKKIYQCADVREVIRHVALTPLNTPLKK